MHAFQKFFIKKQRLILRGILYFLILLLFLGRLIFAKPFQLVELPFVSLSTWVSNQISSVLAPHLVTQEILKQLISERDAFAIQKVEFEQMKLQNASLQKEIALQARQPRPWVAASIIRRSVSIQNSTFMINAGENQHITVGSAVVVDNGMFVGKITHVEPNQSVVTASTSFDLATGVTLFNTTHTIGIARGSTGNLIDLQFIPIDEQIHVNDLVITSGLEPGVPSGLIVGVVNSVKPDPEAPFQNAIVEPLTDIRTHDHVLVIIP